MSVRLRFLLSLLAVLGVMAVPAFYAAHRVIALRDIVLELRGEAAQAALSVGRLQAALVRVDRLQRAYVATGDDDFGFRLRSSTSDAILEASTLRAAGHADLLEPMTLELRRLVELNRELEAMIEAGDMAGATEHLRAHALPHVERLGAAVPPLAAAIDAKTSERVPVAQRSAVAAGTVTTASIVGALVLAIALALAAAGALTEPLDGLRHAMARVADGAFETPSDLPYDRQDEVGDLSRSFRTMTNRLAELDRLKAEFVGTATHDLKTPISIITGYAELIQEELSGPLHARHRELLRSLGEQTQTLQRRVDQLLEISRMEAGHLQLGLEEINVRLFADDLRRSFEPAARARQLRLDVEVHANTPPFVIADPDVLRIDILGNLVGNALKFTPAGGTVRTAVRGDGDRIGIEVADTGVGIPQDRLDHLFEKYWQGRSGGGAGLGLAIARAGVEAHGGTIDVQSRVGRGTRFRVSLPVRATVTVPAVS